MKIVKQPEFLNLFQNENNSKTFLEFLKNAQVKTSRMLIPLSKYAKEKEISRNDLKLIYDNWARRNEYLERFYKISMTPYMPLQFENPPMKKSYLNNNSKVMYKNIIRNLHYKEILQNTKSGLENIPTYMDVLKDFYQKEIIDYKILTPSSLHYIQEGRLGSVFSSYYFRASIMNPYLVYSLNMSVLKGTRIFTPTLGWTSYYYGFMECPDVVEYVGTDVIPSVCKITQEFGKKNYPLKQTSIFCEPSENLAKNAAFLNRFKNYFDVVFFSPPYYQLELYSGKNQSTNQYNTYEEWLEKYWKSTIRMCYHVLQRGGRLCYILSGYGGESSFYDLLKDMNNITKEFFKLTTTISMRNKNVHVTTHRETAEKIMIFTK